MFSVALTAFMAALLCGEAAAAFRPSGPDHCIRRNAVTVNGVASRSFKNSIAVIRLRVDVEARTAIEAQTKLTASSTKLVGFLNKNNVQKLKTIDVGLSPKLNFSVFPAVKVGYVGRNVVTFEVLISRLGAVLGGSVKNGASQISSVTSRDPRQQCSWRAKGAIGDAVKKAREEAKACRGGSLQEAWKTTHVQVIGLLLQVLRFF